MKRDYIQQNKAAFGLQLTTFKNNIGPYATLLSVSAPEVASQAADADYLQLHRHLLGHDRTERPAMGQLV